MRIGPLSSVLISSMGARRTVFLGTCLIMAGYFLAAFAKSFVVICITYGALAGKPFSLFIFCCIIKICEDIKLSL